MGVIGDGSQGRKDHQRLHHRLSILTDAVGQNHGGFQSAHLDLILVRFTRFHVPGDAAVRDDAPARLAAQRGREQKAED